MTGRRLFALAAVVFSSATFVGRLDAPQYPAETNEGHAVCVLGSRSGALPAIAPSWRFVSSHSCP